MIDLTKITLKEAQELVESTIDGRAVRIYANDGAGTLCIHGAIAGEGGWVNRSWRKDGLFDHAPNNLRLKPKTIDFTKLPVDTLVMVNKVGLAYLAPIGKRLYVLANGGTSRTKAEAIPVNADDITLIEGQKVVWEGGKCPLPDGVEVRTKCRGAGSLILKHNCSELVWLHEGSDSDIIWYQITGRIV